MSNIYKQMLKTQTTFFSDSKQALEFFKDSFQLKENKDLGIEILEIDGRFKASFEKAHAEDAVLFYANQRVLQQMRQAQRK